MFKKCFSVLLVAAMAPMAFGQHADIEFGYDDGANPTFIEVEQPATNANGFQFFEAEFEELDPTGDPGNFSADEPGFETNQDEMLAVNPDDQVWLRFLDASVANPGVGVGYVNYVAQGSSVLQAFGRISVEDNTASTMDLILDADSTSGGPLRQFLEVADDSAMDPGGVHEHVVFDLLDDGTTPFGAYGIMFQIESDFADGSGTVSSDPFWVIFNHGLSEEEFEGQALAAFGVVPEPSSVLLIATAGVAMISRRRRRA